MFNDKELPFYEQHDLQLGRTLSESVAVLPSNFPLEPIVTIAITMLSGREGSTHRN